MSVRQKREVLETLAKQFAAHKLTAAVTYSGYASIVPSPVMPRAITKTFGNWARVVKALQMAYPKIFAPKAEVLPEIEVVAQAEPPVEKVVPKPATKPAPKAVTLGK